MNRKRCIGMTLVLGLFSFSVVEAEDLRFRVKIENTSGGSALPGPFAPGVWVTHAAPGVLFVDGIPDPGGGLEALAEDGDASALAETVAASPAAFASGVFAVPSGSDGAGPLFPGQTYEFTVLANPSNPYVSFATMLVRTNDVFAAPSPRGIRLFDRKGKPRSGEITEEILFWDAGTEVNEAPGQGPNQAPLQGGPDTGPLEGVVSLQTNSSRALPLPSRIARVHVSFGRKKHRRPKNLLVRVTNVSAASGAITTPVAPVFFATHNTDWSLFEVGGTASAGLEMLAEDGGPGGLVAEHSGAPGTGEVGAQPITVERPDAEPGPAFPGESYAFEVGLDRRYPRLTIAAMVVESNDAFLAFGPEGIALFDHRGKTRRASAIQADIDRELAVWDAGTEANEVPGVGPNQAIRQAVANTGPADPVPGVRLYADSTNDLAGEAAGGFATLDVRHIEGMSFEVALSNSSGGSTYPGVLTPILFAVHGPGAGIFEVGEAASKGLERLAEDGNASEFAAALDGAAGVLSSGVVAVPVGSDQGGPLFPGSSYRFRVEADPDHPYLSVASMVVPSNDTFVAFGPSGLRLLMPDGSARTDEMLTADIAEMFRAWDAGTERNQAGAAGPDQAPRQSGPDTGADEGDGTVRRLEDPVWAYPAPGHVLRVTFRAIDADFVRGDVDANGEVEILDALEIFRFLFRRGSRQEPPCLDALDVDDNGRIRPSDAIHILIRVVRGKAPFPFAGCGADLTEDRLSCHSFPPCEG